MPDGLWIVPAFIVYMIIFLLSCSFGIWFFGALLGDAARHISPKRKK